MAIVKAWDTIRHYSLGLTPSNSAFTIAPHAFIVANIAKQRLVGVNYRSRVRFNCETWETRLVNYMYTLSE